MPLPLKVVLLIMNCERYAFKAAIQKKTWLASIDVPYYHVLGDPTMEQDYLFSEELKVLTVKTKDDYNSLPSKVIAAYAAVTAIKEVDYIFKTDDDQNLNNLKFFKVLSNVLASKAHDYGGFIVEVPYPHISQYYRIHPELPHDLMIEKIKYCSGRFYFLSTGAVASLLKQRTNIEQEYLEDYAVGYHLPEIVKRTMLQIDTAKHFQDIVF